MIVNAFAHDAADEYVLSYSNHFDYPRDKNVLYIRKFLKSGRHGGMRFTLLVGRFSLLEAARRAKVVRWNINIEEPVRDRLVQFLEEDSGPKVSKKKRAAAKVSPNDGGNEKRLCRAPLVAIQPPPPLTPERQGGGRATGDGTARLPSGLEQLLPPAQRAGEIAPRQPPTAGVAQPAGTVIHYIMDGRVGKLEIPPDKQIILVRKFKENLEPLMCSDTEEVRKKRAGAKYVAESFGAVTTWVPLRTTIIGKHHLSMLKCDAARCRRFYRRFGTKRCTLSAASMRVITAFGLQNSGGSDEGAAAIVAATFMAASMEMGKPLTPTQLGRGSPSQWLLAEWEKRYAAECFVHRCHKMRQQRVKYLHFAGDHGHRQGQDSLVKGWSYAARNKHGERVIAFLCSDVGK